MNMIRGFRMISMRPIYTFAADKTPAPVAAKP